MPITPISKVKTIVHKVSTTANIETIYETSSIVGNEYQPGYKIINFNAFIKNLKVYASIVSLPEADFPNFLPTDSSTQKTMKVLDIEWKSARKQLNVYIANGTSTPPQWNKVGSVSLLNTYGYPFRIYNLIDIFTDNLALELGEDSKIGVEIEDVGYGLLISSDVVTIHGSYTEEMFVISEDLPNIYNFEIKNIISGGGTSTGGTNGGSTPPPTTNSNLVSNSSSTGNNSTVGN